ncbi:alginate lyase family protein [Cyclobacterium amurskyense]|uniref:alginate lyase family protein n=1 Tax=Cyclobacterium amurskyense TaxID=320787 RepID=UPI0030D81BEC
MNPKKTKNYFLLILFLLSFQISFAQQNWKEITSVKDLYHSYPGTVKGIFDHINLDLEGLEKVKAATTKGDWVLAANELLAYYKVSDNGMGLRRTLPEISSQTVAEADTILKNVFTIQNVKGKVPLLDNGHRDWYYKGPNNDKEWAWLSNRHSQLSNVMGAYFKTGNPKYAEYMDLFLRDFILASMPYPAEKRSESIWRGLEVAARVKTWSRVFYGMLDSEYISPATRLLILSSLPDHAHYNRNFHGGNNWLTMEISSLATVVAYFPEYKASEEWMDYAVDTMVESMRGQVYPDGVQTELSSHYHNVSMVSFELFKTLCDEAGRELPEYFNQTIEDMYWYIARAIRPDGHRILNNDGDRGSDRAIILSASEKYNHPEWAYLASNGSQGVKPEEGPSYLIPWAGQLISRSGYDSMAHWSFFDIGPWGSGHQHNDKLHLSVTAYGKDFLVDAGRYAYTGEVANKFRPYALSSKGHNLVLIDGKVQKPGPKLAETAVESQAVKITGDYDFASSSFGEYFDLEGQANHNRSFFYVRGEFWVVVDRISTDQPRSISTLWHWHPDAEVKRIGQSLVGGYDEGSLEVMPVGNAKFDIQMIKGQVEPEIQGWYSSEYNLYEPNVASIYTSEIADSSTFVWLLIPTPGNGDRVMTRAKIVGENEKGITIEVNRKGAKWELTIPFTDSKNIKFQKR